MDDESSYAPAFATSRWGMLLAAVCVAAGMSVTLLGNLLPIEPAFTTETETTCIRTSWRPSSDGDGRGVVDLWHLRAMLQLGTHSRRAEALVRFDAVAPALKADLGLNDDQVTQALAHVAARNEPLTTQESAFVLVVDANVLIASARNELLTTSRTLTNCTVIAPDVSVCTEKLVLADRDARSRRQRSIGLVLVTRADAYERSALGLDATLYVQPRPTHPPVDVAVGLATICWSEPNTARLRHAQSTDAIYSLFLDPADGTLRANWTGVGTTPACDASYLQWLPSATSLPATLFESPVALGIGEASSRRAQTCGLAQAQAQTSTELTTAMLACAANSDGCPAATDRDTLPMERISRRAVLLQHAPDATQLGTARITDHELERIYGSEDLILGATLRFVLVFVVTAVFMVRAYSGLSAIQLLAVSQEWISSTSMDEASQGDSGVGVEGLLDATLLLARIVIVAVTTAPRIGNGLWWLVLNDLMSTTLATVLLLLRLSTRTNMTFERLLMFGGSGWQSNALLGLLTASTALPLFEDRDAYTVLAVFGACFLLIGQNLPRLCVSAGTSYAARTGSTFAPSFKRWSTVAAIAWGLIAFASASLTAAAVQVELYLSARSLAQPLALYGIGLAVALVGFAASLHAIHRGAFALSEDR